MKERVFAGGFGLVVFGWEWTRVWFKEANKRGCAI